MLADRLPRDRRMKVDELFSSMPGALSSRLSGKYLGSMVASLVPVLAIYGIGLGVIFYQTQNPMLLLYALAAFAAIVLPGILFIAHSRLPAPPSCGCRSTSSSSLATGSGATGSVHAGHTHAQRDNPDPHWRYMSAGFFGVYTSQVYYVHVTALQGVESILLLLGITILVMFALWQLLKWHQSRQ